MTDPRPGTPPDTDPPPPAASDPPLASLASPDPGATDGTGEPDGPPISRRQAIGLLLGAAAIPAVAGGLLLRDRATGDDEVTGGLTDWPGDPAAGTADGALAPNFELPRLGGGTISLAETVAGGGVVILNMFATWCEPCVEEMPLLQAAHDPDGARGPAVTMVGIDLREDADRVAPFVQSIGVTFPVALDLTGDVIGAWRNPSIPATVVLSPGGRVHTRHLGPITAEWLPETIAAAAESAG